MVSLVVSSAFVAQMVERRTFNPVVAGSSPAEGVFGEPTYQPICPTGAMASASDF